MEAAICYNIPALTNIQIHALVHICIVTEHKVFTRSSRFERKKKTCVEFCIEKLVRFVASVRQSHELL